MAGLTKPHPCNDVSNFVHFKPPVGHFPSSSSLGGKEISIGDIRAKCFKGSLKTGVAPLRVPTLWRYKGALHTSYNQLWAKPFK
jgi:hypothetical protein